jgi:hypothetical protein
VDRAAQLAAAPDRSARRFAPGLTAGELPKSLCRLTAGERSLQPVGRLDGKLASNGEGGFRWDKILLISFSRKRVSMSARIAR